MKVFVMSKPHAIMSFAFSRASLWLSSIERFFHMHFSSSVSCITRGTLKASCKYLQAMSQIDHKSKTKSENKNYQICFRREENRFSLQVIAQRNISPNMCKIRKSLTHSSCQLQPPQLSCSEELQTKVATFSKTQAQLSLKRAQNSNLNGSTSRSPIFLGKYKFTSLTLLTQYHTPHPNINISQKQQK